MTIFLLIISALFAGVMAIAFVGFIIYAIFSFIFDIINDIIGS